MIERLDRGEQLPTCVPVICHGVQLGRGLRLVGLEGEAVADLGYLIEEFFGVGITFPLGYTNATQLYLTTTEMLAQKGYEVDSYYEYGMPAALAPGIEQRLTASLAELRAKGLE